MSKIIDQNSNQDNKQQDVLNAITAVYDTNTNIIFIEDINDHVGYVSFYTAKAMAFQGEIKAWAIVKGVWGATPQDGFIFPKPTPSQWVQVPQ